MVWISPQKIGKFPKILKKSIETIKIETLKMKNKKNPEVLLWGTFVPNLGLIGRYLDIDIMTHTQHSHRITHSHNNGIAKSQTYKLLVIPLFMICEKPREKVSAQSEKIT